MKTAFFASDAIAVPALEALLKKTELKCVVSNPDRPKGRGGKLSPNDVSAWAIKNGVPLLRPQNSPSCETVEALKDLGVEIVFVMAYGKILRREVLNFAPRGIYNLHGSVLPKYRGASPVETSIALGEKFGGVSLMKISEKMDCGDVCKTARVEIAPRDTAASLREKIAGCAANLMQESLEALYEGRAAFTPQDDSKALYCRKIFKCDMRLDFSKSAAELERRVRAFGGAFLTRENGETVKIGEASAEGEAENSTFGKLVSADSGGVKISCAKGVLKITKLQAPCAKMLEAGAFLNGYKLDGGEVFKSFMLPEIVSKTPFTKTFYEKLKTI